MPSIFEIIKFRQKSIISTFRLFFLGGGVYNLTSFNRGPCFFNKKETNLQPASNVRTLLIHIEVNKWKHAVYDIMGNSC